jgi:hypothetical protein
MVQVPDTKTSHGHWDGAFSEASVLAGTHRLELIWQGAGSVKAGFEEWLEININKMTPLV